jgi:putative methyltransferase
VSKLTPLLSLLLVHDFLFSGSNIAASKDHPLKLAILRHKARLSSEFTKARIRRKCATISELKLLFAGDQRTTTLLQPRWVRVNNLKVDEQELFPAFSQEPSLSSLMKSVREDKYHRDLHIPDLLAFAPGKDLMKLPNYKTGKIILQDKASCFPAYLLLGNEDETVGDVMDACAAPGNKTTHLASILCSRQRTKPAKPQSQIFACERDPRRSTVLQKMVGIAGAEAMVVVLPKQDFFALNPNEERFANITHLLLDPTCSGSGIVNREDVPKLKLPDLPRDKRKKLVEEAGHIDKDHSSKKRKREAVELVSEPRDEDEEEEIHREVDEARLEKLSNLQTRIIERAMAFPAARRISYSTCSTHPVENEMVVSRALGSQIAKQRGWRVLRQDEQVKGLREWKHRGIEASEADFPGYGEAERLACIRCYPGTEEGTMGFFVCCFLRESSSEVGSNGDVSDDEFAGFED